MGDFLRRNGIFTGNQQVRNQSVDAWRAKVSFFQNAFGRTDAQFAKQTDIDVLAALNRSGNILKEYCLTSHKELQCSLVTNGSLLTEEIVSGLLNYNCKFVQITLDGPEYIHNCRRVAKDGSGTFQKVLHCYV